MEWVSLGFNCGGAVLSWIGVAGSTALAPVTGGLSFGATALLYGGAVATSGQCLVSSYRVYNVEKGRDDRNAALDSSKIYTYTMGVADVVGIVGAGGALKEIKETNAVLAESGVGWDLATSGKLSRPIRRRLTMALELQGAKRVSGAVIDRVLRQRLLDATAGVIGLVASGTTGLLKDVVVWLTSEADQGATSR